MEDLLHGRNVSCELLSPQPLSVEYAEILAIPALPPPSRHASLEGSINMTEQEGKAYYGDNERAAVS